MLGCLVSCRLVFCRAGCAYAPASISSLVSLNLTSVSPLTALPLASQPNTPLYSLPLPSPSGSGVNRESPRAIVLIDVDIPCSYTRTCTRTCICTPVASTAGYLPLTILFHRFFLRRPPGYIAFPMCPSDPEATGSALLGWACLRMSSAGPALWRRAGW